MAISGLVLAGGKSSRMKKDKADLIINNKTFQQHAIDLLHGAGVDDIIVSRNAHCPTTHFPQGYLQDIYPNAGPLGGIYSALKYTTNDLLVVAVDMPLMNSKILASLVSEFKKQHHAVNAHNLLHYSDFQLPICIKNNAITEEYLQHILSNKQANRSIKQFIKQVGANTLLSAQPFAFSNINTPADFSELCQVRG